jgi:murein DD-endopeptidase MepM/ murein hydrolase activator NlpD
MRLVSWFGVSPARLSRGLAAAAILLGLIGLPGSLLATLSPLDLVTDYGLGTDLRRLNEVRERLVRRRALQRAIQRQAEALADEIEALRARRELASATLRSEQDEAAALERRLDQLVPRLLARDAAVRERRENAARTLADLASKSRRLRLDPTIRARMLAVGPLMLKRLRGAESSLVARRADPEQAIGRHREIERRAPALMAERQELQRQREQRQRLRRLGFERLIEMDAEIRLLDQEQARLAARFLRFEAAYAARAEPQANRQAMPAHAPSGSPLGRTGDAAVKGSIDPVVKLARDARYPTPSQVVAAAPARPSLETAAAQDWTVLPPPAKPVSAALRGTVTPRWPAASHDAVREVTPLDVVFVPGGGLSGGELAVPREGRGGSSRPIMPMPGEAPGPSDGDPGPDGGAELRIVAAPGQAVATPVAGRVVFANRFKSYGLLLIIEHEQEYHTLLWGFARLDVRVDDLLQIGQIVGIMDAGANEAPVLHVERRRNGQPVNLAASSSRVQG